MEVVVTATNKGGRSNTAQYRCLCPWFLHDNKNYIVCEACKGFGKTVRITFENEETKLKFQKRFCFDRGRGLDNITANYKDCPYSELAEYIWNKNS